VATDRAGSRGHVYGRRQGASRPELEINDGEFRSSSARPARQAPPCRSIAGLEEISARDIASETHRQTTPPKARGIRDGFQTTPATRTDVEQNLAFGWSRQDAQGRDSAAGCNPSPFTSVILVH